MPPIFFDDLTRSISMLRTLATLRASTDAAAVEAKPVCYLVEHKANDDMDTAFQPLTDADKAAGWTETPLYAHPPVADAAVAGEAYIDTIKESETAPGEWVDISHPAPAEPDTAPWASLALQSADDLERAARNVEARNMVDEASSMTVAATRIRKAFAAPAEPVGLRELLEELRDHVVCHACTWDDAINGSHHHPIWLKVAEALTRTDEAQS